MDLEAACGTRLAAARFNRKTAISEGGLSRGDAERAEDFLKITEQVQVTMLRLDRPPPQATADGTTGDESARTQSEHQRDGPRCGPKEHGRRMRWAPVAIPRSPRWRQECDLFLSNSAETSGVSVNIKPYAAVFPEKNEPSNVPTSCHVDAALPWRVSTLRTIASRFGNTRRARTELLRFSPEILRTRPFFS